MDRSISVKAIVIALLVTGLILSFGAISYAGTGKPTLETEKALQSLVSEMEGDKETAQVIDAYYRFMPSSNVDKQAGEVGVMDSRAEYSFAFKAFDKLPISLLLQHEYIGLNNSTVVKLPAHLTAMTAGIETTFPFFNVDKAYLRVGVYPSFFGDDWSAESSRFRIPSRIFAIVQPNEKLTWIAGVAVYPDFQTPAFPILGLIYKPNDKLTFNLVPDSPNISYAVNDKLTAFVEGGLSNGEYEVDINNIKNTKLEYREVHCGLGMKYQFNKYIKSSVSVGGMFNRMLRYKDSYGKVAIDSGLYTEFKLSIGL